MTKLGIGLALLAICVGHVLFSPMKVENLSLKCRIGLHFLDGLQILAQAAEYVGLGPRHVHVRNVLHALPYPEDPHIKVTQMAIGGVRTLLLRPSGASDNSPALVYFHGGGWTIGTPEVYLSLLFEMARRLQIVVVAFDYRKAPEHPFPAGYDDCRTGILEFIKMAPTLGVDPKRLVVAGDSAGGNLALSVVAQLHSGDVPNSDFRIASVGLIYPALQALDFNLPSFIEYDSQPILSQEGVVRYWRNYGSGANNSKWVEQMLKNSHSSTTSRHRAEELLWAFLPDDSPKVPNGPVDEDAVNALAPLTSDERMSPILLSDTTLRSLPHIFLLSCEFDVLRDEALAFAKRLKKLGHPLEHRHARHYHAFLPLIAINDAEAVRNVEFYTLFVQKTLNL